MKKTATAMLAFLTLTGCYVNVPLGTTDPAPGKEIVAEITSAGAAKLAQYLGPGVTSISGNLISARPDSLSVAVKVVTRENGEEQFWKGEAVAISRADIARIAERRLSPSRTAFTAAILAAAGFAVRSAVSGITGGSGKRTGPQPGQ